MTQITYKTFLACSKPYPTMEKTAYINFLKSRMDSIHSGAVGIYLGRRVIEKGQELYFPFLDIDGQPNLAEDEKIESAISNLTLVWNSFKTLSADKYFKIIATGNTGFRMVSNLLINHETYQAFVDFIRCEMVGLIDLKPTMDLDIPHQLFAYKGHQYQNPKTLVDRHSAQISPDLIINETLYPDLYKSITAGKPDPHAIIDFMEQFLDFQQISDLNALGEFGKTLQQYSQILKDIELEPFNYIKFRKDKKPIAIDEMTKRLQEKKILCKVEKRGRNMAISFQKLPCPICGKSTANAVAYPPHYRLKCFNVNCPSGNGMSLSKWAGIQNKKRETPKSKNKGNVPKLPVSFQTVEQARQTIITNLQNKDDVLLLVTPGVGKTYVNLEYLANHMTNKLAIYSCFNKDLQREAYEIIKGLSPDHDRFHLLQSREELCTKTRELHEVISMGYSPAEILCSTCENRDRCEYYKQRDISENGIFFVTHHMLKYIESRFPKLDLLILDENLVDGFRLQDECTERQFRTLSIVLDQKEYSLIDRILTLARNVSTQMMKEQAHPLIINGRKLTPADVTEDSIIGLLSRQNAIAEDAVENDIRTIISKVNQYSKRDLYQKGVDLNAVNWLRGLIEKDHYSYLLITPKGDFFFQVKYITPIGYRNTPVKILDATGDKRTAQNLLRRKLNVIKSDVEWKSTKTHIKTNTSRGVLKFAKDSDFKRVLPIMISQTSATKVMVITYKFLEKKVLEICKEIAPAKDFMGYHFIGPRGINTYKDCEAVIVLGLPYSNLNSSGQDAFILFPRDEDTEIRESWTEACMLWELTQNIHRIRPIYKSNVDIIIASNYWPPILSKPDKFIDKSRSNNWKDIAIQRLEPYVKEFGFLNSDIGYIANVFVKSKRRQATLFRDKLFDVLNVYFSLYNTNNLNYLLSLLFGLEDWNNVPDLYSDELLKNNETKQDFSKDANSICILILVIYILYYLNLDTIQKFLTLTPFSHSKGQNYLFENISGIIPKDIILSNTRQWAILIIYFKDKYPHFESFKMKLPHARNHEVQGVGDRTQVLNFYRELQDFGIVEPVDLNSYVTNEKPLLLVEPIPANFVVAYFQDETRQFVHIGHKNKFHTISFMNDYYPFSKVMTDHEIDNKSILITNNGKLLVKHSLNAELKKFDIVDIVLFEKIIRNGQAIKKIDMDFLFKTYGLVEDVDSNMCVNQMVKVWEHQTKLIEDLGLGNVIKLEQEMIWIAAKIQQSGIGIDVMGMTEYKEVLEVELRDIGERLYEIFPEDISRGDDGAVMEYLNARYGLGLLNMNIGSLKSVINSSAAPIIASLLEFGSLKKERDDIERYLDMNEDDDRIHGEVNQLNTVTGRFYHPLQTVVRRGPMRSFFRAKEGYTFAIADYSQLEPRIIAGLSGDIKSRQVFNQGGDIYMEVAKAITGTEEDQCREFRKAAKEIVLGLNYGMSEYSIYEKLKGIGLSFTMDDIRNFIWKYNQTFPGILTWKDETVKNAYRTGSINTAMGRQMFVSQDTKTTSLFNFPVQGTASDGFKLALYSMDRKLNHLDAQIVHIIHDEVIVEVKTEIAEEVASIIKGCMERSFENLVPGVSFKVNPEIRITWASA